MREKNYHTLKDALDGLPEYGAAAGAWEGIQKAMTPSLGESLPSYRPPAEVWNGLSHELDAAAQPAAEAPVRRMWPRYAAAAASFALLLMLSVGLLRNIDQAPKVSYAYGQEIAPAAIVVDWNGEESSFNRIAEEAKNRNEPALNILHHELEELNEAREEIKAMLVSYGDDPGVVRQLAEIERDRSDIYRRMIDL